MKKFITLLVFITLSAGMFAQSAQLANFSEIAQVENDGDTVLDVFSVPINGEKTYFLCVGTLGIGDDIIQIDFDPLFKLFIPLGSTLSEAVETLDKIKDMYKEPVDTRFELTGCFAPAIPNAERETVIVTKRKLLLTNKLEFALEREGYTRATYVNKSDFSSIVGSVKFYQKLHPKEQ